MSNKKSLSNSYFFMGMALAGRRGAAESWTASKEQIKRECEKKGLHSEIIKWERDAQDNSVSVFL